MMNNRNVVLHCGFRFQFVNDPDEHLLMMHQLDGLNWQPTRQKP